jgi:hypothetical protein
MQLTPHNDCGPIRLEWGKEILVAYRCHSTVHCLCLWCWSKDTWCAARPVRVQHAQILVTDDYVTGLCIYCSIVFIVILEYIPSVYMFV